MSGVREVNTVNIREDDDGNKLINQYMQLKTLGKGTYGKVKLFVSTEDNNLYAVKICNKSVLSKLFRGTRSALEDVFMEIKAYKVLHHPNVVKLFEVIESPSSDKMYLVLEFCEKGVLLKPDFTDQVILEAIARNYFRDAIVGLDYVHKQHITHRDIKPENLLIDSLDRLKISDFSACDFFGDAEDAIERPAGSPAFLAPEFFVENAKRCGRECDVWALGVSLYCMVCGYLPFELSRLVREEDFRPASFDTWRRLGDAINNHKLTFPTNLGADLIELLTGMLDKDPSRRLTVAKIKSSSWVSNAGSKLL